MDYLNVEKPDHEAIIHAYELLTGEEDLTYFPPNKTRDANREIPLQRKRQILEYWQPEGKKKRKLSTVQNQFREVKYANDYERFKRDVEAGGTRNEKLVQVYHRTFEKFLEAKLQKLIIHDIDLKRWSLQVAKHINLHGFKASTGWLHGFKKAYKIVSRKVTKFVTRNTIKNEAEIEKSAQTFISNTSVYIESIGPENTYNADQSGFNKELHTGRTLAECGDTEVHGLVQSESALTHSYTIMPIMSATGVLLPKMLLVLQEVGGEFGKNVKAHMITPPNLHIIASKSGKMSTADMKTFMKECFFPYCSKRAALLLDQWNGHKERSYLDQLIEEFEKEVEILDIPKSTTSIAQPWDVHALRMWKHYVKCLSDSVMKLGLDLKLYQRQNIIFLQSFTHSQFSSPRHVEMFKKAWSKPGYVPPSGIKHVTPAEFAFGPEGVFCSVHDCQELKLVRCTWCKTFLCHQHSLLDLHLCNKYIP
ncbi:hypothetical protein B566_EDAN016281 [Ephemera danica]|nr:hypothetical protein B566_EDAN016281 [Ephemera danica]